MEQKTQTAEVVIGQTHARAVVAWLGLAFTLSSDPASLRGLSTAFLVDCIFWVYCLACWSAACWLAGFSRRARQ